MKHRKYQKKNKKGQVSKDKETANIVRCDIPLTEIKVSQHAIDRYRERTNCDYKDDETVRKIIQEAVSTGMLVEHKDPAKAVRAIIEHKCEKARYFRKGHLVYVLSMDNTVLTVHKGEAKLWRPKYI